MFLDTVILSKDDACSSALKVVFIQNGQFLHVHMYWLLWKPWACVRSPGFQGWLCLSSCESLGKLCNFSGAQFLHLILGKVYCLNEIYIFSIYKAVCHWVLLWHKINIDYLVMYQPSEPTVSIMCAELVLDINCFL